MSHETHALYQKLREGAASAPLCGLLQSLLLLAGDVGRREVEAWARLELGGYIRDNPAMTDDVVVPEYRTVVGVWTDRRGSPLLLQDPDIAFVNAVRMRSGVAELERLGVSDGPHRIFDPHGASLIRKHLKVDVEVFTFGPQEVAGVLSNIRMGLIDALAGLRDAVRAAPGDRQPAEELKNRLELEGFHPVVIKHAAALFAGGHFRQAILDTYIALVEQVKAVSGRHDIDGSPLMQAVFSPNKPVLAVSAKHDEQLGLMWLFTGAVMGVRNPMAHAVTPHPDRQTALEWLGLASALFRVLDGATKKP